jgi:Protein of unknown function (DUF3710)
VFRRRRRDGDNAARPESDEVGYPAAEDELTDGEYDDGDVDLADEYGNDDDLDADGHADFDGGPAGAGSYLEEDRASEDQPDAARARAERADLGDPQTWTRLRDSAPTTPAMLRSAGPWDGASDYPSTERIDFGSLLVPVREGYDVQVFLSEEDGISIAVVRGDSGLQLQPFAAPRSSGLWHEVLPEIAASGKGHLGRSSSRASCPRAQATSRSRLRHSGSWAQTVPGGSCAASSAVRPQPTMTSPGRSRTSSPTLWLFAVSSRSRSARRSRSGSRTRPARY